MAEAIMMVGYPASGKSSVAAEMVQQGFAILNRDTEGGAVVDLLPQMRELLESGTSVLLDNTFPTIESRKPFIELAKELDVPIDAMVMGTSIENAQFNACLRMIDKFGKVLEPDEIKKAKHPNIFPPVVLFKYRKEYEKPSTAEGFRVIHHFDFNRNYDRRKYKNKALILDYDGTLRLTKSGEHYPLEKSDIKILKGRKKKLEEYRKQGYKLLGLSNQSGIAKGKLTEEQASELFEHTNKLLGVDIEFSFCPHRSNPISCFCRKPMPGKGVEFIMKYKLDPSKTIMVGDMKTDETFAKRCGFQFIHADDFFKE